MKQPKEIRRRIPKDLSDTDAPLTIRREKLIALLLDELDALAQVIERVQPKEGPIAEAGRRARATVILAKSVRLRD